ncbi:hypothetical protein QA584_18675 [Anaerocolumna sp. AGMB13025]|uniref:hypothetical protein n=1 Tax=Anaerocolumna sp. AGMB13025 TaxID=3039116 RepID=UPI00242007D7|nr:hypothetical protein [Anaerocolumna sp. AGMB13025]WFR55623.1 hypothetical protein QA584_18675 [Anaerocolumna sp. AGMB13025]
MKKRYLTVLIIICCIIYVSCTKRSQISGSYKDGTTISTEPITASDNIESNEKNLDIESATPSIDNISIESSQTCLQDKKHNVFYGTIGVEEVCLDIYPYGNNITAFYVNHNDKDEIKLVGTLDGLKISLTDDEKNTLTGTVALADEPSELKGIFMQSYGEKLPVALKIDHVCGDSLDNFYDIMDSNNQEVDTFLNKLKKDIISKEKGAVAQCIYYPFTVSIDGKYITINSAQEFTDNYNKIINNNFVNAISTAHTKFVFYNASGIMFGDYQRNLNFCIYKMGSKLKIIGINNEIIPPDIDAPNPPLNTSEPFNGEMELDSETENFVYGTWQVEKLLGFANSWNDASEYPTGQNVIGDKIIIKKNLFDTKGLENYNEYQYRTKDPLYQIETICYNSTSFYRLWKIDLQGLNINDEVKSLGVYLTSKNHGGSIPATFFVVNNDRLILLLEATCFELKKVNDEKNED